MIFGQQEFTDPFFKIRAPVMNVNPQDIKYFLICTLKALKARYGKKITINQAAIYVYNLYNVTPEQIKLWVAEHWN